MSARKNLLSYFLNHVGETIPRDTLASVAGVHEWQRVIRNIRQNEGYDIESLGEGYILHSNTPKEVDAKREAISERLRYAVFHRDNSTCQRCGRTINDGIKLHVDHKVPVNKGGKTELSNLWTLCNKCNGGKKDLFKDEDTEGMRVTMKINSGYKRLLEYLRTHPNMIIDSDKLEIISGIRDWTRSLRDIRENYDMNIQYIKANVNLPKGGYIYYKD